MFYRFLGRVQSSPCFTDTVQSVFYNMPYLRGFWPKYDTDVVRNLRVYLRTEHCDTVK